jgi:hypothetical protein
MSEHDPPLLSPELSDRCRHRLLGVVPIVPIGVEDGYAARCLLCGTLGPAMTTTVSAREVLLDMGSTSVRPLTHVISLRRSGKGVQTEMHGRVARYAAQSH